jgi:hypothetical protein
MLGSAATCSGASKLASMEFPPLARSTRLLMFAPRRQLRSLPPPDISQKKEDQCDCNNIVGVSKNVLQLVGVIPAKVLKINRF